MPMLTFKGKDNQMHYAILLGPHGEKINEQVIKYVAEPVKISGILFSYDNWYVFYTSPHNAIIPLYN
jgi:hypothetical protein